MSQSVVTSDIPFGSAYAYRVGDLIEDDAVKQNKWEDYVARPGTKAANEASSVAGDEPAPPAAKKAAANTDQGEGK